MEDEVRELVKGQDYEVVNEGLGSISNYLERTTRNAFLHFASLVDSATSGRRGKYVTIALNMTNVTTSKKGISRFYEEHADVIDNYFEYVDVVALSKKMEMDQAIANRASMMILKSGGLLATGILIGVAGLKMYNRKKN